MEIISNVHHIRSINVVSFDIDNVPEVMKYKDWLKYINWTKGVDQTLKEILE